MIVSELSSRIQRQFGDESGVQVTLDDILRWANAGCIEIARNNSLSETRLVTNTLQDIADYDYPVNVLTLISVRYRSKRLHKLSAAQIDDFIVNLDVTGEPKAYSTFARTITLYPTPNQAVAGSLAINFTAKPTTLVSSSDTIDLPDEYIERLIEFCLQQAYELDDNWDAASIKGNQFKQNLNELVGDNDWTARNTYQSITVLPEDL